MSNKKVIDNPHLEGSREEFLESNIRLVYSVVTKMKGYLASVGMEFDDAVSVGSIGLIKAYDKFDGDKFDVKFSTYAVPMIQGELLRVARDTSKGLRVSRTVKEIAFKIRRGEKEYKSYQEVMEDFDVSASVAIDIIDFLKGNSYTVSFELPVGGNSDTENLTIEDMNGENDDYSNIFTEEFIKSLDEQEQITVKMTAEGYNQSEIGKVIGVSQVEVSRNLKRLRKKLTDYIDHGILPKPTKRRVKRKAIKENTKEQKEVPQLESKEIIQKTEIDNPYGTLKSRMKSKGYGELYRLLDETNESYNTIKSKLNLSYSTVAYYGRQIRSEKRRINNMYNSTKNNGADAKVVEEKPKKEEIKEELNTSKEEKSSTLKLNSVGNNVTNKEFQESLQKLVNTVDAYDGEIVDYFIDVKVRV